jgi:hypothetical protein
MPIAAIPGGRGDRRFLDSNGISDDYVSAKLVGEWLHARNELSASKFFAGHPVGELTRLPRLKASPTASSGGIEHPAASVRHSSLRGCGESSVIHPSLRRMCTTARLVS